MLTEGNHSMRGFDSRHLGIYCCFLLAVLVFVLSGCGSPAAGEPDNFRGVKWGTDFSSLSGFNQIAQEGELTFYEKNNDPLQTEDIRLDQVIYGFYKGRFYTAMIYFSNAGFARMQEIMTRQLGTPSQPDKTPSKFIWDAPNVSVLLTSGDSDGSARLSYLYKPIQLEVELKK
jgi:hypothetical protein